MSITVNTNMSALRIQNNLSTATNNMNTAMERMSSGSKINSAKDDAAGYAVAKTLSKAVSGTKVASNNVAVGNDLLSTTEGVLEVVASNLQRIRDLAEQASNGTYTSADRTKIKAEIDARMSEISSLTTNATFNGKTLFKSGATDITIQSGTTKADNVVLDKSIFGKVTTSVLSGSISAAITAGTYGALSGLLDKLDTAITGITTRITDIGAAQNKLEAVSDALTVQKTNLSSALSTIKDADVAEESASYVQSQILQSASATLLTQANSAPQIALTLIKG